MADGLLNSSGNTSAPSADLMAQFQRNIASGNYAGAASLGRNAGYSDADIAAYTGSLGMKDKSGNAIDTNAANQFLSNTSNTTQANSGVQNGAGYVPPSTSSGPTADQQTQFSGLMNNGNFDGAAAYGRSLGYTDQQIADYTGSHGYRDGSGNITTQQASSYLSSHPTTATKTPVGDQRTFNSAAPGAGYNNNPTSGNYAFQQGRDSAYNQATSRLDPQWNNNQHDLENQLTQQGIMRGSDAWNRAVDDFGRNKNDAYSSAWNNAWNNGLAGQNQAFTQDYSNRSLAQQGNLQQQSLNLQDKSLNNTYALGQGQLALGNKTADNNMTVQGGQLGLQANNQTFNQDLATKNFDYNKQKDLMNIATSSDNATKNGLFGLGAAALTNPNTVNLLKQIGGDLLDAAGKVTSAGISWLNRQGIGGGHLPVNGGGNDNTGNTDSSGGNGYQPQGQVTDNGNGTFTDQSNGVIFDQDGNVI
jgi:hypothetical protein